MASGAKMRLSPKIKILWSKRLGTLVLCDSRVPSTDKVSGYVQVIEEELSKTPNDPTLLYDLAVLKMVEGKRDEARALLTAVIELSDNADLLNTSRDLLRLTAE